MNDNIEHYSNKKWKRKIVGIFLHEINKKEQFSLATSENIKTRVHFYSEDPIKSRLFLWKHI